jgi:hypothetical protein
LPAAAGLPTELLIRRAGFEDLLTPPIGAAEQAVGVQIVRKVVGKVGRKRFDLSSEARNSDSGV